MRRLASHPWPLLTPEMIRSLAGRVRAAFVPKTGAVKPTLPDPKKGKDRLILAKTSELNEHVQATIPAKFRLATLTQDDSVSVNAEDGGLKVKKQKKGKDAPVDTSTDFLLLPILKEAMKAQKLEALNQIQKSIIPEALKSNSKILCASETGSGKTLAYLLPILHKLKVEEQELQAQGHPISRVRQRGSPRALILVPSAELAHQIGDVAKYYSHHIKLRVGHLTRSMAFESKHYERLFGADPIDLIITTPHQVLDNLEHGRINLDSLKHVAIDEADSMLSDDAFSSEILQILKSRPTSLASSAYEQLDTFLLTSATISESVKESISKHFGGIKTISSNHLHHPLTTNKYRFFTVDGKGDAKQQRLISILKEQPDKKTLIFCNTSSSASLLHNYLEKNCKLPTPGLVYGDIPELQRLNQLDHFRTGNLKSLIATDVFSRGIDTKGWVHHVIIYDFPLSLLDFIHRAGRAGRAGTNGIVSSLVTASDRRLAEYIRQAINRKIPLGSLLPKPSSSSS